MARERDHGTDRRASAAGGVGGAVPGGAGRDRGAALPGDPAAGAGADLPRGGRGAGLRAALGGAAGRPLERVRPRSAGRPAADRKSTRLNSSHANISYAVFCLKKKTYPYDINSIYLAN